MITVLKKFIVVFVKSICLYTCYTMLKLAVCSHFMTASSLSLVRDKFVPVSAVNSKGKVPWMSYKAAKLVRKNIGFSANTRTKSIRLVKGHQE